MLLIQDLYLESTKLTPIPYSRFQTLLNENKVEKIAIAQNYISGSLKEAQPDGVKDFITARVDPELAESLDKHGVVYSGVIENHWLRDLLSWILPAIFFVGIWMFAIRRMGQGGLLRLCRSARAGPGSMSRRRLRSPSPMSRGSTKPQRDEQVDFISG